MSFVCRIMKSGCCVGGATQYDFKTGFASQEDAEKWGYEWINEVRENARHGIGGEDPSDFTYEVQEVQ